MADDVYRFRPTHLTHSEFGDLVIVSMWRSDAWGYLYTHLADNEFGHLLQSLIDGAVHALAHVVRHLLVSHHVREPRLDGRDRRAQCGRERGDGVRLHRRLRVQLDGHVTVMAERRLADGADGRLARRLRTVELQRLAVLAAHEWLEGRLRNALTGYNRR